MKNISVKIRVSDQECQELVSWIAEKIIQYQDRDVQVLINDKVIVDQIASRKDVDISKKCDNEISTGYTIESEGLEKDVYYGSDKSNSRD